MFGRLFLLTCVTVGMMIGNESVQQLSSDNYNSFVSQGVVVVKFYASWCNPCTRYAPIFMQVARDQNASGIKFAQVNVEKYPELAQRAKLRSLPSTVIYKNGHIVVTRAGLLDATTLRKMLAEVAN